MYLKRTEMKSKTLITLCLKSKKSPGLDNILTDTFKQNVDEISPHICFLTIIATGYRPSKLKEVVIKPIYKMGNKPDCVNFRPISLFSNLGKVLDM